MRQDRCSTAKLDRVAVTENGQDPLRLSLYNLYTCKSYSELLNTGDEAADGEARGPTLFGMLVVQCALVVELVRVIGVVDLGIGCRPDAGLCRGAAG